MKGTGNGRTRSKFELETYLSFRSTLSLGFCDIFSATQNVESRMKPSIFLRLQELLSPRWFSTLRLRRIFVGVFPLLQIEIGCITPRLVRS